MGNKHSETYLEKKTNSSSLDDSIIDVTGQSVKIDHSLVYKKYEKPIPYWSALFIFSYNDLNLASPEQKIFYHLFRSDFKNGIYIDLQGNTNYAFILLFDLVEEYDVSKNMAGLENSLLILAEYYPETKEYALGLIEKKKEEKKQAVHVSRAYMLRQLKGLQDKEDLKLGERYKTQLNLNNDEIRLLNRISYEGNSLWKVGYSDQEIIKLFLKSVEALNNKFIEEGTLLEIQLTAVAQVILKYVPFSKFARTKYGSSLEATVNDLYYNIMKCCENMVRTRFSVTRKMLLLQNYSLPRIENEFEVRILSRLTELFPALYISILPPDRSMEIELNVQNMNRWKTQFKELTIQFKKQPEQFLEEVIQLVKLNSKNPSIKFIYYEATKFTIKKDLTVALKLYILFLYYERLSVHQEKLIFVKEIKKTLFKTKEQLSKFESIQAKLKEDRNLEAALESATYFYNPKRKKIHLDKEYIKEVVKVHTDTVELLGSYLQDEDEINYIEAIPAQPEKKVTKKANNKEVNPKTSLYRKDIPFTELQLSLLELFSINHYLVSEDTLKSFSIEKCILKNQLIDSINELCYDIIDDILIEEEDDKYIINPAYFSLLLAA